MAINVSQAFHRTSANPVDDTMALTKAQMLTVNDNLMPSKYLTICQDDGFIYLYDKSNTADPETGKFRKFEGGGGGGTSYTAGDGIDITGDVISTEKSASGDIDEIIDRYPTAGELVSIVNAFNKGDLYSADERMVGQWIDGKPLYQKTFEFTPSSYGSGSEYHIPSSVTGLTNYFPVGFELWDVWSECINNGIVSVRSSDHVLILKNATIPYPSIKHHMTLRYFKMTDKAVSIGEANDYSTTEKIIGTWVDGKPLYQRSVVVPSNVVIGSTFSNVVAFNTEGCSPKHITLLRADNADNMYYGDVSYFLGANNASGYIKARTAFNSVQIFAGTVLTVQYTKTT